jgi:hypothetical protein
MLFIIILIRRIGDTGNQCGWKILVDCLKMFYCSAEREDGKGVCERDGISKLNMKERDSE